MARNIRHRKVAAQTTSWAPQVHKLRITHLDLQVPAVYIKQLQAHRQACSSLKLDLDTQPVFAQSVLMLPKIQYQGAHIGAGSASWSVRVQVDLAKAVAGAEAAAKVVEAFRCPGVPTST